MRKKIRARGFTLIELLVVIAIIGILASVVLASLNDARERGSDAAIISSINNMRAEAELYFNDFNSYIDMCDDPGIQNAIASAQNVGSADVNCVDGNDVPNAWAIEAQLVSSSTAYYCVDSSGASEDLSGSSISDSGTPDAVCD